MAEQEDDNIEGWVDEIDLLTTNEVAELENHICPLQMMLIKIQKLSFKIILLMTILLPAWKQTLNDLGKPIKMIPHDVVT
ncbi:hypothetical protein EDD16DRAFT_1714378 [Pisolithus croceorrhizus]|nr:hypothetical protein EV401DRAFT_2081181 [Pisolithus croceorrhizus]KAI6104878.1 hypothetical protein EDD16DRAFT_1714378 [Pisolithus croceorrhizus]KAI6163397.1 hypothetical protein EDD17DRAFT_1756375 [Pisolithus thermaeus]